MTNLDETFENLAKSLIASRKNSHTMVVVVGTALLEELLGQAIKGKLRPITTKFEERLFDNYGPFSSFSARIDVAYALDILTDDIFAELNKLRRIRNKFAHSGERLSLEEEPILSLFNLLKRDKSKSVPYAEAFMECVGAIARYLLAFLERAGISDEAKEKPRT
jgi:DNA-binding MltR family transcriptional regulator